MEFNHHHLEDMMEGAERPTSASYIMIDEPELEEEQAAGGVRSAPLAWHVPTYQQPAPAPPVSWMQPEAALPAPPHTSVPAPSRRVAPLSAKSKPAKPRKPGGKAGITLRMLIEEGILEPGHDVLTVDYKGMTQVASLMPDGRISSSINGQQMVFESPSAFSICVKKLVTPGRKADDGWKTVRYNSRVLEQFKAELTQRQSGDGSNGGAVPAHLATSRSASQPRAGAQEGRQPTAKRTRVDSSNDLTGTQLLKQKFGRKPKAAGEGAGPAAATLQQPVEQPEEQEGQRTRPRRQVHKPPRYGALGMDDEHALLPLEAFGPGPPGAPGAQPYVLYISPAAEVSMDHHAHLSSNEIIGMLAGHFEPETRTISVLRAHPVREMATANDRINAEMEPADEWRVRQEIADSGLRVLGWYHSHPTFPTQPSMIDVYNQVLQQHHHRDEASDSEPYVAAIVSPFDKRLHGFQSAISWFYVDHPPSVLPDVGQRPEDVGCVPKALQTLQLPDDASCAIQAEIAAMPEAGMLEVALRYAGKPGAVDMASMWRDGCTVGQKLVHSLLGRLPAQWTPVQQQDFVERVQGMIATASLVKPSTEAPEPSGAVAGGVPEPTAAAAAAAAGEAAAAWGPAAQYSSKASASDNEEISDLSD